MDQTLSLKFSPGIQTEILGAKAIYIFRFRDKLSIANADTITTGKSHELRYVSTTPMYATDVSSLK